MVRGRKRAGFGALDEARASPGRRPRVSWTASSSGSAVMAVVDHLHAGDGPRDVPTHPAGPPKPRREGAPRPAPRARRRRPSRRRPDVRAGAAKRADVDRVAQHICPAARRGCACGPVSRRANRVVQRMCLVHSPDHDDDLLAASVPVLDRAQRPAAPGPAGNVSVTNGLSTPLTANWATASEHGPVAGAGHRRAAEPGDRVVIAGR